MSDLPASATSPRKVIALRDVRDASADKARLPDGPAPSGLVTDRLRRPLRDLRISVTDRCNFRCSYCMPKSIFDRDHAFLPQTDLLRFEEITRLASLFVAHGVDKIRLTGGEPLLRKNLEELVSQLAALRTPEGHSLDLTLTTNASLLRRKAASLKAAGLKRLTISLDALDDAVFRRMNDMDFPVADVLDGLDAALDVGFADIKVNMVVKRGTNDHEIVPMAAYMRQRYGAAVSLRFIEYMDVGSTNGWRMDEVLPSAEVLARLRERFDLVPLGASRPGETAERWQHADGAGEVGFISSVTKAFCGDCNRARLSTDGKLYTCLFATTGHDLRGPLRSGTSDAELARGIGGLWAGRDDRYSQLRSIEAAASRAAMPKVEMSYIGG